MESEEVWDGISDEDLLAVDLDEADQQTKAAASPSSAKKRDCSEMLQSSDMKSKENSDKQKAPPLELLRGGYLWVSDFSSQLWCEQQLEYKLTLPPDVTIPEPEQVTRGSELHLARELQVHDYVNIKVTSDEDIFAVKFSILDGQMAITDHVKVDRVQEVPIFGVINGVFIIGKIDEIRVDKETFNIDIVDLKTRKNKRPPSGSQKATHNLQVMVYKRLFDDLVRGLVPRHSLTATLNLDLNRTLGDSINTHISAVQLTSQFDHISVESDGTWTLSLMLDMIKETAESLPFINQLFIDYVWQEDHQTFLLEEVKYDGIWFERKMTRCLEYWQGKRECQGVDIEEAWKCHSCEFQAGCKWLTQKQKSCNRLRNLSTKNVRL